MANKQSGIKGAQDQNSGTSEFNSQTFLVRQFLSRVSIATLVQVVAVTNAGALSAVGFVDAMPLVNQLDGSSQAVPHGVIHSLPYFRMQGGANAVIIDPQVGDIGICIFADRDISGVKAARGQANPGSRRRNSMADGLYIGGVLNGAPTQYVQFNTGGIKIHSPAAVILDAPDVQITAATVEIVATTSATVTTPTFTINGATTINGSLAQGTGSAGGGAAMAGPLTVAGDVTAGGKSLKTHTHGGVQTGSGTTGAPS